MADELFVWIPRWEEFQHYAPERDRAPAWIKDYTKQLDDDRYLELTDRQRALLRDLRDIFAIAHGRLRYDARRIARRRNCHTRDADLDALNHAGLIAIVSRETLDRSLEKFYSDSRARARPRPHGEVEREEEKEHKPKAVSERTNGKHPQAPQLAGLEPSTDPDADIDFTSAATRTHRTA